MKVNKNQNRTTHTPHKKAFSLVGIPFPTITERSLTTIIQSLSKRSKKNMYFMYAEYFVRAYRNNSYQEIFTVENTKHDNTLVLDGRGVEWASYILKNRVFSFLFSSHSNTIKQPFFRPIAISVTALYTLFHGWFSALTKQKTFITTHNQVILGRTYKDTLFEIATQKGWKTLIIGAFDEDASNSIQKAYPRAAISFWSMDSESTFMKDISAIDTENRLQGVARVQHKHNLVSQNSLTAHFPQVQSLVDTIKKHEFDLIIVACGGESGKQEFIMKYIQDDPSCMYTLCCGLGAAFDHLGAGKKQQKVPDFLQGLGLEFVFRMITNPLRAYRIVDTVIGFWLLVVMYPFRESALNPKDKLEKNGV